ncbi:hypothetical protein NIES4103_27900 [Nostoc sp. NIES-4103]|nr:hypothetical protein NIES4103_27900 [Nostoc sp. NIES-4103]
MKDITKSQIPNQQTIQILFASFAWLIYLLFVPYVYVQLKIFSLFFMIFPGVYLFCWLAVFMHECWHEYLPSIHNKFFYLLLSWMMFLDHQIFAIVHPFHHSQVNTYKDIEFHPVGEIKNHSLRVIYNFCEIFLGNIFTVILATYTIMHQPHLKKQYSQQQLIISILMRLIIWGGTGYCSHLLLGVTTAQIVIPYVITCWMGSLAVHHSELIEHGNLIIEGKLEERNLKSRNLKPSGIWERLFLFITHNHSLEHSLHHVSPKIYNRPFAYANLMPDETVYISFAEYLIILKEMLTGKCSEIER